MLTDATQARSHELMLKQDQNMLQSSEGMAAVQEAYQYLIQVILCQRQSFLHQLSNPKYEDRLFGELGVQYKKT